MFEYNSSDQSESELIGTSAATSVTPYFTSALLNGDIKYIGTRKGARQFFVINYTANQRSGSKISAIWHYRTERRRLDDGSINRYWRCTLCKGVTVLKIREGGGGQTSYALRYFKNKHNIELEENISKLSVSSLIFSTAVNLVGFTIASVATRGYKSLVSTVDVTRFRKALVIFIVMCNIAFLVVKSVYF
jgi:hypothetical protein